MHLAIPTISPEKQAELDEVLTIFNFSDVDFLAKGKGRVFRIRAHSTRQLPASYCYLWFGDPSLRRNGNIEEAMVWERTVRKLMHRYFVGNEASPNDLFFNKYIVSGKIGCRELLQRFAVRENLHLDLNKSPQELLAFVASRFYGKSLLESDEISDGGQTATIEDMAMFTPYRLAEGEDVREMSDADVVSFANAMFGSEPTPTFGKGDYQASMDPRNHPETAGRYRSVVTV